eukprot:Protomagalhaensia_wolfi_Nauph_80__9@NODE_1007_length_1815_cov_185_159347_g427_i2_p2_GENE_NODE_1007_length_1815_cov_185_159347_g427_i2NODE_1007_length_1815_cov_185_159347_g427_i2_p2_ORF_typecomplete_len219_score39_11RHD3/PF05879_12/3_5e29GBP/PF02263_19/0_0052_NODE_1007_length_1815_cov_185_159347_g427_i211581778
MSSTIIVDVEGTDSPQRKNRQTIENQTTCFSLAIADTLLINITFSDVTRHEGSGGTLWQNVFSVILSLFMSKAKCHTRTALVVVIRNYPGADECDWMDSNGVAKQMVTKLESFWSQHEKPREVLNAKFADYFDLHTFFLPSLNLQREFRDGVQKLKKKLTSLKPKTYSRKQPADGFASYAGGVWNQIRANKELDLPTMRVMIASRR